MVVVAVWRHGWPLIAALTFREASHWKQSQHESWRGPDPRIVTEDVCVGIAASQGQGDPLLDCCREYGAAVKIQALEDPAG